MIVLDSWISSSLHGSLLIAIPVAVVAGLLSFASPCVLPLLPAYLSCATGLGVSQITEGGRSRTMLIGTIGFVGGFAAIFVATGAVIGGIGATLIAYQRGLTIAAGIALVIFGAMFAGVLPVGPSLRLSLVPKASLIASPLLGAVFALGWTPCIGPALATVLSLSLNEASATTGAILAFAYALGLGLPFVVIGVSFGRMTGLLEWLRAHTRGVQWVGGGFMIAVGIALASGAWDVAMAALRQWLLTMGAPI